MEYFTIKQHLRTATGDDFRGRKKAFWLISEKSRTGPLSLESFLQEYGKETFRKYYSRGLVFVEHDPDLDPPELADPSKIEKDGK